MTEIHSGNWTIERSGRLGDRLYRSAPISVGAFRRRQLPPLPPPALLVGREVELGAVRSVLLNHGILEFHAPCGYGVSTLLSAVAAGAVGVDAPYLYIKVGADSLEDILARLVTAAYVTDVPIRPTRQQCAELLAGLRHVVILDDVGCPPAVVAALVHAMPHCAVLLGTARPLLPAELGASWALTGLAEDAAMLLLARALGRALHPVELTDANTLVRAVQGVPLPLLHAAALVRDGGHSLASLVSGGHANAEQLERLSVQGLSTVSRRALGLLAIFAGAALPGDVLTAVIGAIELPGSIAELKGRHLVDVEQDCFGLPACARTRSAMPLTDYAEAASAGRELVTWFTSRTEAGVPPSVAEAGLTLLRIAAERGDHETVVLLARCLEPVLMLAERWEVCVHLLDTGIDSARRIGDLASEAYFSHQRGTLALVRDDVVTAQLQLQNAVNLRQLINDGEGVARSAKNLGMLSATAVAVHEPDPQASRRRQLRTAVTLVLTLLAVVVGTLSAVAGVIAHNDIPGAPGSTAADSPTSPHGQPTQTSHGSSTGPSSPSPTSGHPTASSHTSGPTSPSHTSGPTSSTTTPSKSPDTSPPTSHLKPLYAKYPVLSFMGNITPGSTAKTETEEFTNPNDVPVTVMSVHVTDGPFAVLDSRRCQGELPRNGSCAVDVAFTASTLGTSSGHLELQTREAGTTTTTLDGTGFVNLQLKVVSTGMLPSGAVTANQGHLSCPDECTTVITSSSPITLTINDSLMAVPRNGPYFEQWEPPCGLQGPTCDLGSLTKDTTVTADFGYRIE
jgi:hypothetical protein